MIPVFPHRIITGKSVKNSRYKTSPTSLIRIFPAASFSCHWLALFLFKNISRLTYRQSLCSLRRFSGGRIPVRRAASWRKNRSSQTKIQIRSMRKWLLMQESTDFRLSVQESNSKDSTRIFYDCITKTNLGGTAVSIFTPLIFLIFFFFHLTNQKSRCILYYTD